MIEIRLIDEAHKKDIGIPNEPFLLYGRMIPSYTDEKWSYETVHSEETSQMRFPDENYDYGEMKNNCVFLGAYDGEKCVALAVLQHSFLKYMYLYDLKVSAKYRRCGVASALIQRAKEICAESGYRGLYTVGQDNNLSACLFYLKCGFYIGGLDTNVYKGSLQEGKADIIFYLDC